MIIETGELRPIARAPRPGWTRPLIAAVAALTIAMGGVLGAHLITGRAGSGLSALSGWAPADAALYMEADLSLPGSQRASLESLLARWPALDSDLVLGDGFAGWVDGMLTDAEAPVSYRDDLAPWLTGSYAFILPAWPEMTAADMTVSRAVPEMVVVIGSRDRAAATAFTDRLRGLAADKGATFSSSSVGGLTVWSLDVGATGRQAPANAEMAYAVADGALLLGTGSDAIGAAVEAHAGSSLSDNADVGRLSAALPSPRVSFASVDVGTLVAGLGAQLGPAFGDLEASTGDHVVMSLSLADDRLVATTVTDAPTGDFAPQPLSEPLAERIPGDALAYGATPQLGRAVGIGIHAALGSLVSHPATAGTAADWADAFESAVGFPLDDLLTWAGDSAFYAGWDGAVPTGGVVILTADPAAARLQVDRLMDALVASAASSGSDLVVTDENVDGATVTRITEPSDDSAPVVEVAITDDSVNVTFGAGSAARLIRLAATDSLGASPRFGTAIQAVGGTATSPSAFVDLAGILAAVASQIPADASSTFDMFVRPNLAPFDYVASASHVEGGLLVQRADLVLR
jgi:hypothetical protein